MALDEQLLEVLKGNPMTRDQLVKKLGIPRTTIYDSLNKLKKKKIVKTYKKKERIENGRSLVYFGLLEDVEKILAQEPMISMPPAERTLLESMKEEPQTIVDLAKATGMHYSTAYTALKNLGLKNAVKAVVKDKKAYYSLPDAL